MAEPGRESHASVNGDRWRLLLDPGSGRSFVCHTGNPASGDHVSDVALVAFLHADRGGIEHAELWQLIGTLANDAPALPAIVV